MQRSQGVTGKFIFTVWPDKSPGVFQCSLKSFSLDFSKGNRLPPTDPEGLLGSRILSFLMGEISQDLTTTEELYDSEFSIPLSGQSLPDLFSRTLRVQNIVLVREELLFVLLAYSLRYPCG